MKKMCNEKTVYYEKTLVCSELFLNESAHDMKLFNYSEIYLGPGKLPISEKNNQKSIQKINSDNQK